MPLTVRVKSDIICTPSACALQQHPRYGAAVRALGAETIGICVYDGSELVGTNQTLRRRFGPFKLTWYARGPVPRSDVLLDQMLHLMPANGTSLVIPESSDAATAFKLHGHRAVLTPQYVAELDLTLSQQTRRAGMHVKWRNRLKKAEHSGCVLESRAFDPNRDMHLLSLETAQRQFKGYTALPVSFTNAYAATAPDATVLFVMQHLGEPIAFMLFLLHPPIATYHVGWISGVGRRMHAHNLILWNACNELSNRGFKRLDLGSIDTERAPGLARFKLGSGAKARALGATLLRFPHPFQSRSAA